MKKNAFTLIELMAILVILSVLTVILIPTVKESINEAKKDAYNNQVDSIKKAAESYFINSNFRVDETSPKVMYITDIVSSGYFDADSIKNPIDDSKMKGCIVIKYYSKQYHYEYIDNITECSKYPNIKE